jgi:hypothetical protein
MKYHIDIYFTLMVYSVVDFFSHQFSPGGQAGDFHLLHY